MNHNDMHGTTILSVRRGGRVALGSYVLQCFVNKWPPGGAKSLEKMNSLNISYVGDLQVFTLSELEQKFGKMGKHFYQLANGIDQRIVKPGIGVKSISKEHTFSEDVLDEDLLKKWIYKLAEHISSNARTKYFFGRTITIKFREVGFKTFNRSLTLQHHIKSHIEIYQIGLDLLNEFLPLKKAVRLIGIGISHNDEFINQINALEFENDKTNKINSVKDKLNTKFGKKTIFGAEGMT